MELSAHDTAQLTGITTRTLRYYDAIGLLHPSRLGNNGYRFYDDAALRRLQRIIMLRNLGLGLAAIRNVLDQHTDEQQALQMHVRILRQERQRLTAQIAAVEHTIDAMRKGRTMKAEEMFDGFDYRQYQSEVEQRWGSKAYERSQSWWESMSKLEQQQWMKKVASLNEAWIRAANDPKILADSPQALDLARRHVEWLTAMPGTPAHDSSANLSAYVRGLAQMYVADERFAANYGGVQGAEFVRAALMAYLEAGEAESSDQLS